MRVYTVLQFASLRIGVAVFLLPLHPVSFDSHFLTETHTLNQCASMGLMQFLFALIIMLLKTHYYKLGPTDFSGAHPRDPGVLGRKMNTGVVVAVFAPPMTANSVVRLSSTLCISYPTYVRGILFLHFLFCTASDLTSLVYNIQYNPLPCDNRNICLVPQLVRALQ